MSSIRRTNKLKRYSVEHATKIIEDFYDFKLDYCDDDAPVVGLGVNERTILWL